MVWTAEKPKLTEKQLGVLNEIISSRTSRHDHIQRAKIIKKSAEGLSDVKISTLFNVTRITVAKWRERWLCNEEKLSLIDAEEFGIDYKNHILEVLSDLKRAGTPTKFSSEQICQIINTACEVPEECGLPLSHWSLRSLSEELVKRKIITSISSSQLAVFLKSSKNKAAQS